MRQKKHELYCWPKHLWTEFMCRIHNSPTGGHKGITGTAEKIRKRFYFPVFSDFLANTLKNCLTWSQLKIATAKNQFLPLYSFSSLHFRPREITELKVFSKHLFGAPLANSRADIVARELTHYFFTHSSIPKKITAVNSARNQKQPREAETSTVNWHN